MRGRLLAVMALVVTALPAAVNATAGCVVSAGVTQTDTTVTGTDGNDTIDCSGAGSARAITGGAGNDTVTATPFADDVAGDDGNDTLTGGAGDDALRGGAGDDTLTGGEGTNTADGGPGTDTCSSAAATACEK